MNKVVRLFEDDGTAKNQREMIKGIAEYEVKPSFSEKEVIENAKDAEYIIVGYEQITENVLRNLPNLKMVAFQSIGVNGIDMKVANELNLPVSHIATYCVPEVADYVAATILADNRKLFQLNKSIKDDKKWEYDLYPNMRRLSEQTVGFLGFGNIPRAIRQRLASFGCKIIAYDPFLEKSIFEKNDVTQVEIEEVFLESDFISLHLPLNPKTEKSIGKDLFDITQKHPTLINSSRGGVINEEDLLNALDSNQISFAYLDVLESESPNLNENPLVLNEKTLLTPHSAFYSVDSMKQSGTDTIQNIINFIENKFDSVQIVNRKSIILDGGNK